MTEPTIHQYAVLLGSRGGLVGGHARARRLSSERRHEIAVLAAKTRWKKPHGPMGIRWKAYQTAEWRKDRARQAAIVRWHKVKPKKETKAMNYHSIIEHLQKEVNDRVAVIKALEALSVGQSPQHLEAVASNNGASKDADGDKPKKGKRGGSVRVIDAVQQAFEDEPDRVFHQTDVAREARARGAVFKHKSISPVLTLLFKQGIVKYLARGEYQYDGSKRL